MAISFVKAIIAVGLSGSPATGPSFTPGAASDQLLGISLDGSSASGAPALTGTGTYTQLGSYFGDDQSDTWGLWENSSCSGASQTCTVTSTAGDAVAAILFECSGVGSVSTGIQDASNSGGTGAILGASVTVPSESVLLGFCADMSGGSQAISSPSGTNWYASTTGAFGSICAQAYAGTGAAIQPTYTSTDTGTNKFVTGYFLLTPSGGGSIFDGDDGEFVIFVMSSVTSRDRFRVKRGWRRDRRSRLVLPNYSIRRRAA